MVANIRGYTPNYAFKLVNFDTPRWHTLEYANWTQLDSMLLQAGIPNIRGEWIYSTLYYVGDRVFDGTSGVLYRCLVQHTSAAGGTFADDRAAHPTYWTIQTAGVPLFRGVWQPGATYSLGDIVVVGSYIYYLCITNHLSSPAFGTDAAKWTLVFDATAAVNTTNANATASATSASQAATSATNAATSATNAQNSAIESAAQAAKLFGTSTSSVVIGTGGKTFVTQASKYFNVGKFIMVRANADPVNQWMWGQVTAYAGTSLSINSVVIGGSGTFADWIIDVSGSRGAIGPQGIQGELGPPLVIKGTVSTASALPPTGNTIGDMWIAEDNQHLYIWDGTQWDDAGPLGTSTTTTADIPPSNPKDGDMWFESDTGIFWVYYDDGNSRAWVQAGGAAASINQNFVLKTGDTMTGALAISMANPLLVLNKPDTSSTQSIASRTNNQNRWIIHPSIAAGDDFAIARSNDAGVFVDFPIYITRTNGAVSLASSVASTSPTTGALTVAGGVGVGGSVYATFLRAGTGGAPIVGGLVNAIGSGIVNVSVLNTVGPVEGLYFADTTRVVYGAFTNHPVEIRMNNVSRIGISTAGTVTVTSATIPTSSSTGALIVAGGVGVNESIFVGANASGQHYVTVDGPAAAFNGFRLFSAGSPRFNIVSGDTFQLIIHDADASAGVQLAQNATAWSAYSDGRMAHKQNARTVSGLLNKLSDFRLVEYGNEHESIGVIAQELHTFMPQLTVCGDDDEERIINKVTEPDVWTVKPSEAAFVALQIGKELYERIQEIERLMKVH